MSKLEFSQDDPCLFALTQDICSLQQNIVVYIGKFIGTATYLT